MADKAPAGNPFRRPQPGEPFRPSSAVQRALIDLLGEHRLAVENAFRAGAVEFPVKNTTASNVVRFGVLQVNAPITARATDETEFFGRDALQGVAPAANKSFVVFQEPVAAGAISRARIQGLTRVQIDVTDAAHAYAKVGTATDKLTSVANGPVPIIWKESGTGTKWAVVLLTGQPAVVTAGFARFTLPGALATTDASKASCTVDDYWGGPDPGATITVYNLPASSNYIFSGASGNKGLATWDDRNSKWWIVQMQCP